MTSWLADDCPHLLWLDPPSWPSSSCTAFSSWPPPPVVITATVPQMTPHHVTLLLPSTRYRSALSATSVSASYWSYRASISASPGSSRTSLSGQLSPGQWWPPASSDWSPDSQTTLLPHHAPPAQVGWIRRCPRSTKLWCSESSHLGEASGGNRSTVGRRDTLSSLYDCSLLCNDSRTCEGIAAHSEGSCTHQNTLDIKGLPL